MTKKLEIITDEIADNLGRAVENEGISGNRYSYAKVLHNGEIYIMSYDEIRDAEPDPKNPPKVYKVALPKDLEYGKFNFKPIEDQHLRYILGCYLFDQHHEDLKDSREEHLINILKGHLYEDLKYFKDQILNNLDDEI